MSAKIKSKERTDSLELLIDIPEPIWDEEFSFQPDFKSPLWVGVNSDMCVKELHAH